MDKDKSNWIKASEKLPERNKYVLVHTPFCAYKCAVAFWNGVTWRSAEDKAEVWNISYWQELPNLPVPSNQSKPITHETSRI